MRIALKYCGSCNPGVDLSRIGNLVVEQVQGQGWEVVPLAQVAETDVLVLLCGCPRTCIDTEELRQKARQTVLVAGKRLEWQPITEEELPSAIVKAISYHSQQLYL
jgi:hypothetical protein